MDILTKGSVASLLFLQLVTDDFPPFTDFCFSNHYLCITFSTEKRYNYLGEGKWKKK